MIHAARVRGVSGARYLGAAAASVGFAGFDPGESSASRRRDPRVPRPAPPPPWRRAVSVRTRRHPRTLLFFSGSGSGSVGAFPFPFAFAPGTGRFRDAVASAILVSSFSSGTGPEARASSSVTPAVRWSAHPGGEFCTPPDNPASPPPRVRRLHGGAQFPLKRVVRLRGFRRALLRRRFVVVRSRRLASVLFSRGWHRRRFLREGSRTLRRRRERREHGGGRARRGAASPETGVGALVSASIMETSTSACSSTVSSSECTSSQVSSRRGSAESAGSGTGESTAAGRAVDPRAESFARRQITRRARRRAPPPPWRRAVSAQTRRPPPRFRAVLVRRAVPARRAPCLPPLWKRREARRAPPREARGAPPREARGAPPRPLDRRLRRRLLLLLFDDFLESPRLCFLDGRLLLCDVLLLLSHRRGRERARPLRRLRRERRREVEVVVLLEQAFGDALERVQPEALPSRVPGQTAAAGRLRRRGSSSRNGLRGGDGGPRAAERRLEYRGRRLRRRRRGAGAGERPGTVFRGFPLRRAFRRERRRRERRRSRKGCRRGCPRARRALYCRARREREGLRSRARRGDALSVRVDRRDLPERRDVQRRGRTRLGRDGGELPRSRRSSSPASMSHAVAIVKARGDGTREKREFDNRRQVARPRVRARARFGGNERKRGVPRNALSEVRSLRFFGCICHPTRQRTDPRFTVRSGRKNLFSGSRRFSGAFLSPDRRSQRRDRDTPRHGPAFRFRPWLERSRFTAASRPPHPPSSPRRCVRRAVPPSRPTPPRKREIAPRSRAVLDGRVLQGTRTSDDEPRLTAIPHRTRRPLSRLRRVRRNPSPPQVTSRRAAVPPPRACRPPPSRGSA